TLTFDITATVQGWIGQKNPNYGLLVRSAAEATTIGRVAFYSSKTQSAFQPKLELYYSLPPQQEFDNSD
ncbi:MAG: DNRLRE domain-containing protein, partial [candidate division KSB1 bacterium]|nr:DNRLRE domain-containing protein [candidate division KSB1 bacterium]